MNLTDSQCRAVAHTGGNLQLVACAGSGKTEVVARYVSNLLSPKTEPRIAPAGIIAFTFTDKAAAELKECIVTRCRQENGDIPGLAELFVGTIHAFCLDLLKTEVPKFLKYEVLNEVQQALFVDRHSKSSGLTTTADIAGRPLQRYKDTNHYVTALSILREAQLNDAALRGSSIVSGLNAYRALLHAKDYLDYSSILEEAVNALLRNEQGKVLRIHTDRFGEVSKKEEDKIRREAREIDSGRSRYRAVVSVLMLREGWDVRNVSVILGLRPFSAKANILPEQAVGRGLRLMRKIPMGNTQILELIGTQAFEDFVRELEKEGLGVGTVRTPPNPGKRIYPADERSAHDIEIPRTTALFEREFKNIEALDPLGFGPIGSEEDLGADLKQKIELIHGTVDVTVHSDEVVFDSENVPPVESLLASLTNRVMRRARITGFFPQLYPKVRTYVRERCFGGRVELDEISVRRALNDSALMDGIASLFSRRIGELTAEKRAVKVAGDPWRLGGTDEFLWRRHFTVADKTIFNVVACFNAFEADFAHFLDKAPDVVKFAKLCEHFTGFHIQYLKTGGALGTYYPDFAVVQQKDDERVNWIVETKGQEDVEVAAKDEQMKRWCAEVTAATGIPWRYAKVPYRVFHGKHFSSFGHLVRVLSGESGQLVLPLAAFPRTDSDSGPPDAVVEVFWNRFGPKVPASAIVLASREALAPEGVQDVLNQPLSFKVMKTRAFLFFVDLEPEANWAHACAYAFVAETGETAWCDARWPPRESIPLIRKDRP